MKVSMEDISSVEKKLTVTIDNSEVIKEYAKALNHAANTANLKGFRKGKAPKSMVESLYAEKISEDVISTILKNSFEEAMKEMDLKPIAQPRINLEKFDREKDLTYTMIVELMPEFEVADYSGFELKRRSTAVTDSDVEEMLKKLRNQHAVFTETNDGHQIKENDMVIFDFTGSLSDGTLIRDGHQENFSVVIGSGNLIPGFEENLKGLKKGDKKEFVVTFPEDYFEKEYAGADVKFKVAIKEIKEQDLPALDDNFAKDIGEYATLDELKKYIREQLTKEKAHASENNLREQIVEKLIETNSFEVPNCLIEKQLDMMVEETKQNFSRRGQTISPSDEATMRKNSKDMAHKMVKRDFILEQIITKEELLVSDDELNTKYDELAASFGRSVDAIRDYYRKINGEKFLKEEVLVKKAFDLVADQAKIIEEA